MLGLGGWQRSSNGRDRSRDRRSRGRKGWRDDGYALGDGARSKLPHREEVVRCQLM